MFFSFCFLHFSFCGFLHLLQAGVWRILRKGRASSELAIMNRPCNSPLSTQLFKSMLKIPCVTEKDVLTFMLLERKGFVWNWSGSEEKQEHIVFGRQIRAVLLSSVIFSALVCWRIGEWSRSPRKPKDYL